jgi:hypothetical protein
MDWNRNTKKARIKIGKKEIHFEDYLIQIRDGLPKIDINGKPMDHETGLIHCVLLSHNWNEVSNRIAIYVAKVNSMYEDLKRDKEEFDKKHLNDGNTNNHSGSE